MTSTQQWTSGGDCDLCSRRVGCTKICSEHQKRMIKLANDVCTEFVKIQCGEYSTAKEK